MGGDACVALGGKGARKVAFSPIERTMGGDACVARGEGQGKRSSAHAPSRINPTACHPERSEGSRCPAREILRFAQDDNVLITMHRLIYLLGTLSSPLVELTSSFIS